MSAEEVLQETRRYGNHLGVEFGAAYHSNAVISDGTTPLEVEDSFTDYAPSATPGCRAPHVWLGSEAEPLSTLDLFGAGLTVLVGSADDVWRRAATDAARRSGVPLAIYAIGDPGLDDRTQQFLERYGIRQDGVVLVRPDGYVAWRATSCPGGGTPLIQAIRKILRPLGDQHSAATPV
jgi:hypothetical protein